MTTAPQGDPKGRPYILSAEFLNTLVAELDNGAVTAIILAGSYTRGNATPYSDVDFARFVKESPGRVQKRYTYREGRLISIVTRTISIYREWLKLPERAIWIVPDMRGTCSFVLVPRKCQALAPHSPFHPPQGDRAFVASD